MGENICLLYDKFDVNNQFIIINRSNLELYFERYKCSTETELIECLWINYGITIQII